MANDAAAMPSDQTAASIAPASVRRRSDAIPSSGSSSALFSIIHMPPRLEVAGLAVVREEFLPDGDTGHVLFWAERSPSR